MELRYVLPELRALDDTPVDALACGIFADERPLSGLAQLIDWRMSGGLSALVRRGFFDGEADDALCMPGRPRLPCEKIVVLGLGHRADFDWSRFERALERMVHVLERLRSRRVIVELPGRRSGAIDWVDAARRAHDVFGSVAFPNSWWFAEADDAVRDAMSARERPRAQAATLDAS